ncbi:MAG TPA: hypothetical protein VFT16_02055 [Candidatus Saccharimonadales bacterium]|nr:hypothetical protein [Candidatus Saccharimonadales bacterium]
MANLIIALYVFMTSSALIIMKYGASSGLPISVVDHKIHVNINFFTVAGLFAYFISFALYVYLISKYDLGYIIPIAAGFTYAIIFIASFLLFKESFTLLKVVGIALVVLGIILVSGNK